MKKRNKMKVMLVLVVAMISSMLSGCQIKGKSEETATMDKQYAEDEKIIKVIDRIRDSEYVPSDFVQKHIDSDTVQWFCASYAIFNQVNAKELNLIGGLLEDYGNHEETVVIKMQGELELGWEITSRETAMEKIQWLVEEGHSKVYTEMAEVLIENHAMGKSDWSDEFPEQEDQNRIMTVQQAYQEFGEDGLAGWDLSRALQVIGDCYHADYINLEEVLELSLPIALKLQSTFDSWEELTASYLYGYQYWKKDDLDNSASEVNARRQIYEDLAADENGPYQLSYDTKLVCTWDEETVRNAKAEQEKREKEEQEQREKEEEKNRIKMPELDEDGYYTIYDHDTDISEKVKMPEGYTEGEFIRDTYLHVINEEKELELFYSVEVCQDVDSVNAFILTSPLDVLEAEYDSYEVIKEELEQDQEPMRFYTFVTYELDGEQKQGNIGYLFRMLDDGSYQGIYVKLRGAGVIKLSEEEALDMMFLGMKIN